MQSDTIKRTERSVEQRRKLSKEKNKTSDKSVVEDRSRPVSRRRPCPENLILSQWISDADYPAVTWYSLKAPYEGEVCETNKFWDLINRKYKRESLALYMNTDFYADWWFKGCSLCKWNQIIVYANVSVWKLRVAIFTMCNALWNVDVLLFTNGFTPIWCGVEQADFDTVKFKALVEREWLKNPLIHMRVLE